MAKLNRVYVYGMGPPTIGANLVDDQILKGHQYYNTSVEIGRLRRQEYRRIRSKYPGFTVLEDERDELKEKICRAKQNLKDFKSAGRTRKVDPELKAELATLVRCNKVNSAKLKALTTEVKDNEQFAVEVKALDEECNRREKKARGENGLYWGNYLLVEKSVKQAFKAKIKPVDRTNRETGVKYCDPDPWFHLWAGEGRIGVQIQKQKGSKLRGISVSQLLTDSRVQIDLPDPDIYHLPRGQRIRASRTKARIRVGSTENHEPIWAEFPIIMHRPLPEDARITWAVVKRSKDHLRSPWKYELAVVFESEKILDNPIPMHKGTATINFGWRQMMDDSLRVAMVNNPAYGTPEEIRVSSQLTSKFDYSNRLKGIIQKQFDVARNELIGWLKEVEGKVAIPEWLSEIKTYLHLLKKQDKLARLVWRWKEERFEGDDVIFASMRAWSIKWAHLHDGEQCNYSKALNGRKDFYRKTAARLCSMHETIVIEDFDLTEVAVLPSPERSLIGGQQARTNRVRAAISELRTWIESLAPRYHCTLKKVPAELNTKRCSVCGKVVNLPVATFARKIVIKCTECGAEWDQDDNNTLNQHKRVASGEAVLVLSGS